jgi:predicted dithiol-disulfide oxidoreductase (DUF899 family)
VHPPAWLPEKCLPCARSVSGLNGIIAQLNNHESRLVKFYRGYGQFILFKNSHIYQSLSQQ